ncbi:MAG: DinB family protein [Bacteroidota bacterium]
MSTPIQQELKDRAVYHFQWNQDRILGCLDQISEAAVWQRPNEVSNSIGNQILHLCGNIGQYILSSLAQAPDTRERSVEFATQAGFNKQELASKLKQTTQAAIAVIEAVTERQLLRKRKVQAFDYSGIAIIMHATEHYSYHTGQIIFWTKQLKEVDLDFYGSVDLG